MQHKEIEKKSIFSLFILNFSSVDTFFNIEWLIGCVFILFVITVIYYVYQWVDKNIDNIIKQLITVLYMIKENLYIHLSVIFSTIYIFVQLLPWVLILITFFPSELIMSPELFLNVYSSVIHGDLNSIDVIETNQNYSVNSTNPTENTGGESPPAPAPAPPPPPPPAPTPPQAPAPTPPPDTNGGGAGGNNGGDSPNAGGNNDGDSPHVYTDEQYAVFDQSQFLRELTESNMEKLRKSFPKFRNLNHKVHDIRNNQNEIFRVLHEMEKVKNNWGNESLKNEITRLLDELLHDSIKKKKNVLNHRYLKYQDIKPVLKELKQINQIARGFDPELSIWLDNCIRDIEREIKKP